MAFEPLETDEKLDHPVEAPPDMDRAMLFGCSGFVVTSIGGYLLSVWPFLVFPDTEQLRMLVLASAAGFLPAAVTGCLAARYFGLAGACGFVGAALATGIFLYLRIQQVFLSGSAGQAPTPEYPQALEILAPLAWILIASILAVACLPKDPDA